MSRVPAAGILSIVALCLAPLISPAKAAPAATTLLFGHSTIGASTNTSATFTIAGNLGSGGAGATVKLIGPSNLLTTADGSGNYVFTGLSAGTYAITPSSASVDFSPSSQSTSITNTNVSGINFTTTATSNLVFFDNFTGNSISPSWSVISRHGEYSQNETECNIPQQVVQAQGYLTITAAAQNWICGDFYPNGTVYHQPSTWPYITGDMQWATASFTYGTVEIRGKFPSSGTSLWPAFWLLGSNCQSTNPFTGEPGVGSCSHIGTSGYTEIDTTECYISSGWCQFHVADPGFGIGGGCDATYPVDTTWHTFRTEWTYSGISQFIDGNRVTTCARNLSNPMFLIMQIQTGGVGGSPNNSMLPADLSVDYVKVTSGTSNAVTIQSGAGWNMVGGSPFTVWSDSQATWAFNASTPAWFQPTGSAPAGTGAWEYVSSAGPRAVTVQVCGAPVTVPVTAHRWNLVGNPCSASVALPGAARAYWWDPTASRYVPVTSIGPGSAAWVEPSSSSLALTPSN